MFEKAIEIGMLFDFYGKLLSNKQHNVVEFYYMHDLSLSEIAEQLDISRQGVYDILKRAENRLYMYEEQLGLVEKFNLNKYKVKHILKHINVIENQADKLGSDDIKDNTKKIREIVLDILESNQEGK
ncbi:YlxM family DNA-binding protein [Caldisalinibacter kiritimatiensis]|uniref:UPF0122 protein L21TH_0984 n=1 Tax=Caldisalinibacter kiritimatiensis TaxID=1304284 RepID=R1AWG4_9FIRM|nr:putative DNA-binding protein [Caldisalinibacter kiritimatiensis]EOD00962.1 Signal recognition particle associated protein [Caldisalinibacter kiritimatiensis]